MKHNLIKTSARFECTICKWTWKSKPVSICPGVQRFEWGTAPENLKTVGQLKKVGLKPNSPRVGLIQTNKGYFELFNSAEAIPFTPDELAAEKERKRQARYRICKHCKQSVRREKWNLEWQACDKCLDGVIEAHYERERIEEEERQEEHEQMVSRDRDEAIQWARDLLAGGKDVYILDTETTGLSGNAEIVQVAIIDLQGSYFYETFVKPVQPIPSEATLIHGITNERLANAPKYDVVHRLLMDLLSGKKVITYNADFDIRMIYQSGKYYGYLPVILADWDCAMLQYAAFCGEWNEYHGSYRWQSLPGGDHSAHGDCKATLELIKTMAAARLSTELDGAIKEPANA